MVGVRLQRKVVSEKNVCFAHKWRCSKPSLAFLSALLAFQCLWAPDRVLASIFEDRFLHPGPVKLEFFGCRPQALQCNSRNPPCFLDSLNLSSDIQVKSPALFTNGTAAPGNCIPCDTNSSGTSPVCAASSCHLERTWILITARRYQPSASALQTSGPLQLQF